MSYEHCDVHDTDCTNGCAECEFDSAVTKQHPLANVAAKILAELAKVRQTAQELQVCADAFEPAACIVGNITAAQLRELSIFALTALPLIEGISKQHLPPDRK